MTIQDCLDDLVIACNGQLVVKNAGPRLVANINKFINIAKKHQTRCGSHCWVLTGLEQLEAVKTSGNIVKDASSENGFSFSLASTRIIIRQAIRAVDGIQVFHERHQRRCPYLPGWQSPEFAAPPERFGLAGELNGAAMEYYRRFGDEGYSTDDGDL